MKTRHALVSNSSSSSFICEACNGNEIINDGDFQNLPMFECENGHLIHVDCGLIPEERNEFFHEEYRFGNSDDISAEYCPVCQFKVLTKDDKLRFFKMKTGITDEEILEYFKSNFEDMGDFYDFIRQEKEKAEKLARRCRRRKCK